MNAREEFWKGDFGNEYNKRSPGDAEANYQMFKRALFGCAFESAIELGAGTGANLRALRRLRPTLDIGAVEINSDACAHLASLPLRELANQSILEWRPKEQWGLAFTKGVLIHIAPDDLPTVYAALYYASTKFVMIAEYYNPTPVEMPYRGHSGRLWKRDFAGEILDHFPDLKLIDYGFVYRRDAHPQDDLTWFLMEKQ